MPATTHRLRIVRRFAALTIAALLAGCATPPKKPSRPREEVRAQLTALIPPSARDRAGWALDITDAFYALDVEPTSSHLCAALAVIEQESGFVADPPVPNLGLIAQEEIDRRAGAHHVPAFAVHAAMAIKSSDGRSYNDRIAAVRTERELSLLFEDLIGRVPLGQTLFADSNPVKTGGPMQASVAIAEAFVRTHPYPYPYDGSIRHEVFSRRGGVYFGIAHLLAYPVSYDRMIYRFADYNAGYYASRNAAFQNAVHLLTQQPLAYDGDLIDYASGNGHTELAVRSLGKRLDMDDGDIHAALAQGEKFDFEKTPLYAKIFALADRAAGTSLPRTMLPQIDLDSPKITRRFTTAMFAESVERRYRACLARATPKN
ncbi:MAG: DUF1615 domain-containing protein [Rudaea sp.]|uniref:DUF1615 domain-containing protein n=1 Tax=Rudaea sp. TaxID=2136325 RepID=UPI0039E3E1C1